MSRDHAVELIDIDPPHGAGRSDPHAEPVSPDESTPSTPRDDDLPPASAARPRRRFGPRTLTSRLVAGVVVLVTVLVLAIGVATYATLSVFLRSRLDEQLRSTVAQDPGAVVVGSTGFSGPQQVWLVLLDPQGRDEFRPSANAPVKYLELSDAQRAAFVSHQTILMTIRTSANERLRVGARATTYEDRSGQHLVIMVVGLSTAEVSRTLHQVIVLELVLGASAVLLAFVATAWGVRLSLRPLRRVTRTAQEVTAELSPEGAGLDRRVLVTEADTEVGQVAQSVNTLLGAVETQFAARVQSEDRMRQFLADASHELRTPLTSIRGYAELSRMRRANRANGESDSDSDSDSDTLDRIESEGTRMSRLVEDLLLLARSDQGVEPRRNPVEVGALIADAVDGVRAAFTRRRIDVVVRASVIVEGDRDQLLRMLRNLIANAAEHTAPSGPIRVSGRGQGHDVVLEVTDSGPGLPPEDAAHVFERFWRADKARTRAQGGTGLGLAIVASIVQSHGGTVSFDSSVERGSTVTVRLPAGSRPA